MGTLPQREETPRLAQPVGNSSLAQVVRRHLQPNAIAHGQPHEMLAHLSGQMRQNFVLIIQFDPEHGAGKNRRNRAFEFDRLFSAHAFVVIRCWQDPIFHPQSKAFVGAAASRHRSPAAFEVTQACRSGLTPQGLGGTCEHMSPPSWIQRRGGRYHVAARATCAKPSIATGISSISAIEAALRGSSSPESNSR